MKKLRIETEEFRLFVCYFDLSADRSSTAMGVKTTGLHPPVFS